MFNRYAYVANDPVNKVDPNGEESACFGSPCGQVPTVTVGQAVGAIADFTPVVGDIKGIGEAIQHPTPANIVGAGIGLVPGAGDLVKGALKNSDLVVRGGSNTADRFTNGSGVTTNADGTLTRLIHARNGFERRMWREAAI
jgi:hypothetical protein